MSFSSGEIAFTIAVATLVALVYVFYNVFVKKSSDSTQNEVEKQETSMFTKERISSLLFLSLVSK